MSDTSDKFNRSVALDKALAFWATEDTAQDSDILKTAEAFRAFLAGEDTGAVKVDFLVQPANLMFEIKTEEHQPRWVYFRYRASKNIYYRSDITKPETQLGNIERKGYFDQEWRAARPSVGNPMTRAELRDREDYVWVPRSQVPAAYLK